MESSSDNSLEKMLIQVFDHQKDNGDRLSGDEVKPHTRGGETEGESIGEERYHVADNGNAHERCYGRHRRCTQ